MAGWGRLVRELGQSWLDVLRAELAGLEDDLARSGNQLKRGAGLFGGSVALGFWAVGALVVAAIGGLAVWLPLWAAALIVAVLFAAGAIGLAVLGRSSFARVENPVRLTRQRLEDHMDWVQSRLLATTDEPEAMPRGGAGGDRSERSERRAGRREIDEEELP